MQQGDEFLNRMLFVITIMLMALASSIGCGSGTSSDTWLIAAGGDTATVSDVGAAWIGLDEQDMEMFSSRDNPVGQFVLAYARKMMLDMELESGGHLADPAITNRGEAWLRFTAGAEAMQHLRTDIRDDITDEDVSTYLDRVGKGVWYTLDPGTDDERRLGPTVLADVMPAELGAQLDSMSTGMVLPAAIGGMVRLDSIQLADAVLLEEVLADTAGARELAMDALTALRSGAEMQGILDELQAGGVFVDTAAIENLAAFYRGQGELDEGTVVTSDLASWTSTELRDEVDFLSSRMYAQPGSEQWLLWCVDNILMQMVLVTRQGMSADHIDSLQAQADAFMADLASERLYDQIISSTVTVTEEDVVHQFQDLSEPLLLPERRVLRIALVPLEEGDEYRSASQEGRLEEYLAGLGGIPGLTASASSDRQLTRPLLLEEVPGGYGDTAFQTDPDSSMWLGPFPLDDSGYHLMMMVHEVIPAGAASLEDRRSEMELAARTRLEEEATLLWMRQLEEKYGLDVNEGALDDLPEDPALWCSI